MTAKPAKATRYKAVVSYDGTEYAGYQIQVGSRTVQEELEKAIERVSRQKVRVFCSGRTDQGVHARGQVIHFDLEGKVDTRKFSYGLNSVLPEDVRVVSVKRTGADFDARMSASGKEYRYFIWNHPALAPDVRKYRAHVWKVLDVKAMQDAAMRLEGKHDFAPFSANPGREIGGTVRTLTRLRVIKKGPEVVIVAAGDGFLYKMVRSLAGFLLRVGLGELDPQSANDILRAKKRTGVVPTAVPQGLFLWKVDYGP